MTEPMDDAGKENAKIKVVSLTQTCEACPSQWDGLTDDNRQVYVRYRFGSLTVQVGEPDDADEFAGCRGRVVAEWSSDDEWDGSMSEGVMRELTAHRIDWALSTEEAHG